jgi:hypothetical protein
VWADDLGCLDTFLWIFGLANWILGVEISISVGFASAGHDCCDPVWESLRFNNELWVWGAWLEHLDRGNSCFADGIFTKTKCGKNCSRHTLDTCRGHLGCGFALFDICAAAFSIM